MTQLGLVLGWKFDNEPGIETSDDRIVAWPKSLGRLPNSRDITAWTLEYETYRERERVKLKRSEQVAADLDLDRTDIIELLKSQMSAVIKHLRGDSADLDKIILAIDKAESDYPDV